MAFGNDPFAISSGGGVAAVASHDFAADPQASIILNDIFESGKSYKIVGKGLGWTTTVGSFMGFNCDLVDTNDATVGSFKFKRSRDQSSSTTLQQSALTNRSIIETGLNMLVNELHDFEFYLFHPNDGTHGLRYRFEFSCFSNTGTNVVDDGFAKGGLNTYGVVACTGFKFPATGNDVVNKGTIEVFEL